MMGQQLEYLKVKIKEQTSTNLQLTTKRTEKKLS